MPPKGAPAPSLDQREQFARWVEDSLRQKACEAGIAPGPAVTRRLNREELTATLRDLLDIHLEIGGVLPAEGAGGEGFDNAAETLFLSPLHAEKYLEIAKFATDFAQKEYKSRLKIFVALPGPGQTETQAARAILSQILPQAFRRPIDSSTLREYFDLFQAARKQGQPFENAIFFALRAALVSPRFLFRIEPPQYGSGPQPLDGYTLASRISYFLWGSMPDEFLFDVAASGKLHEPAVLKEIVGRMLRHDRSLNFAQRFVEQWLRTRDLERDKAPDAKLFPQYAVDEELRSDIRNQPVLFFRELLVRDLSLLNLIESSQTIATSNLAKHYNVNFPIDKSRSKQPQWVDVPEGSHRGGLLGMAACLIVSSYPYRTSPVLRGAWILDSILGTPPPPPPENVPPLEEAKPGAAFKSVRERLFEHRRNAACASCHSRIDGLGFALENFDAVGRWREEEGGRPVDASGELPDGTPLRGPAGLKAALIERKDQFLRNLTAKMLGYALGRSLTWKDACAVDEIVTQVKAENYRARGLVEAIVMSIPFRFQAPTGGAIPAPAPSRAGRLAKTTVVDKEERQP
ncbi:MAG: DUF1592 domain-containing protein [Bryobacteraceae bacterium]|nr:DUF1592 domain-containing protein [Bryobacteraceae bacterium]MDW8376840.1 DUF1592 domain-containing protein [Bryobacterales bacterium]